MPHIKADVAIETERTVHQQRQIVEPAGCDAVHADTRRAHRQIATDIQGSRGCRNQAVALLLRKNEFAVPQYIAGREIGLVIGAFERQRQRPASGAVATGRRAQAAIEMKSDAGFDDDRAAITGHRHRRGCHVPTAAWNIQDRPRSRGVEQGAGANDDKGVGRRGLARFFPVQPPADADRASIGHQPIAAPLLIDRGDGARRGIEHCRFPDPHQPRMSDVAIIAPQSDRSAPRIQRAIDRDGVTTRQAHPLSRIDRDPGPGTHRERAVQCGAKCQAGTGALCQLPRDRIGLISRRGP